MGKLLIFAAVIIAVVIVLGLWGYFLKTRENASKAGLKDHKKRLRELESSNAKYVKALEEVHEIATSSEAVSGDPLWSMVIDKVDMALEQEIDK